MEERILVESWEWKPDCSGLQNEWEVRKKTENVDLWGEVWMRRRKQELHPLKEGLPSLEELGRGLGESGGWESDVPWTPEHTRRQAGSSQSPGNLPLQVSN